MPVHKHIKLDTLPFNTTPRLLRITYVRTYIAVYGKSFKGGKLMRLQN